MHVCAWWNNWKRVHFASQLEALADNRLNGNLNLGIERRQLRALGRSYQASERETNYRRAGGNRVSASRAATCCRNSLNFSLGAHQKRSRLRCSAEKFFRRRPRERMQPKKTTTMRRVCEQKCIWSKCNKATEKHERNMRVISDKAARDIESKCY